MRARKRQGQVTPEEADQVVINFGNKVIAKMPELDVDVVYNAEQTAVNFEYIPTRTVARTGEDDNYATRIGFGPHVWRSVMEIMEEHDMVLHGNPTAWWNASLTVSWLHYFFCIRPDMTKPVQLQLDDFSAIGARK
ncbi:TPA: hypothetical protein N0F65_010316 [Lagenidium giganteum]|uniref:Uncharacterized protein n=1 Tax=Lagenidium giganteum TaxID=4803 RepID=A0AAV2Z734_9STRA|nr:TPA: hypothetical protein N0F65_010316 [Lagenidium giganteum]